LNSKIGAPNKNIIKAEVWFTTLMEIKLMSKNKPPVSDSEIRMLQAYLDQIVSIENKCKDDFSYTEWYLEEKYSEDEVNAIINFFRENGVKCDCGILKKFN
jgi:hypothetical protein